MQVLLRRSGLRPEVLHFSNKLPGDANLTVSGIHVNQHNKAAKRGIFFLVYKVLLRMAPAEAFP